ncbi:Integrase core domain-containing protein [Actinokineospora iranica]|uniref:Integrase core domain-containing protein n=1 Tax=Actinokineospora iranica TaxID=1271860 RepID=A0A1G6ZHP8_9PSEU|nr:Integrase core domain-containing protein [Actinokineospora iranica]
MASVRRLVLRLAAEISSWGYYRRIHGELALLGVTIAPSTVWEILKAAGIDPAPHRATVTWAEFPRSQAEVVLAMDFIETVTLTGARQHILALPTTPVGACDSRHNRAPNTPWVAQAVRNLLMDLEDACSRARVRFLIRDRDGKYPALIDDILSGAGIATILTGVRVPRMNAIMERWVKTPRVELLDRTLIWNEAHLRHALHAYEQHYNKHRTHRSLAAAAPLRARSQPLGPDRIERLAVLRRDRIGGVLHEYRHPA